MSSSRPMIPQADPGASYRALRAQIDAAALAALASGWYILGKEGEAFEKEFAAWLGAAFSVGCANGTDALVLALRGLGIGPGDAVATVPHTAVATVAAIEMVGATPLLVDIDARSYTMAPSDLAETLADPPAGLPPVRAVIPVHIYGMAAELDPILATARRHDAAVIEDCAQAHGATYRGAGSAASGGRRRSAFTRPRILALSATPGRSPRMMRDWPSACVRCANTAGAAETSPTWSA